MGLKSPACPSNEKSDQTDSSGGVRCGDAFQDFAPNA
jgi:hypothetical protein